MQGKDNEECNHSMQQNATDQTVGQTKIRKNINNKQTKQQQQQANKQNRKV